MAAGRYDIIIEEGATFQLEVIWYDRNGVAVDITGWGATLLVKEEKGPSHPLLIEATTNDDLSIPVGTDGRIVIALPVVKTTNLAFATGHWHLLVYPDPVNPDLNTVRLVEGTAYYSPKM